MSTGNVIACPHCQGKMKSNPQLAGRQVACPHCKRPLTMPGEAPLPDAMPAEVAPVVAANGSMDFLDELGATTTKSSATSAYCRNCGKPVDIRAAACMSCGLAPLNGNKYCRNCGAGTNPAAVVCVKCGVSTNGAPSGATASDGGRIRASNPPKDPVLMCVLSVLLIGLGQMLLGQTWKGITMLTAVIVLSVATCGFFLIAAPIVWLIAGLDAYRIANKLKQGKTVAPWEFF